MSNAERWRGAGPGGSDLVGWKDPKTGASFGTDERGFVAGAIPIWSGGGGGGEEHGGEEGGAGLEALDAFLAEEAARRAELDKRATKIEGFLDKEFREYIRGNRGLGEDFIANTLSRQQDTLNRQRDQLVTQAIRSANRRGVYRSTSLGSNVQDLDKALLSDLSNVEKDLRTQTALINMEQKRFGTAGLSGIGAQLRGAESNLANLVGQGQISRFTGLLNQEMANAQLAQQESQFGRSLGLQERLGFAQIEAANRAAKSQERSGKASGFGSALGGLGGAGLMALSRSDDRLKKNFKVVGQKKGFNIYEFNFKDNPLNRYRGVVASEVINKRPDAVAIDESGHYLVDYKKLGIPFEQVD